MYQYGFEYDGISIKKEHCIAALLVYSIYRSKGESFQISTDMWDRITRYVKSAARRATDLPGFIEVLVKKMNAYAIKPEYERVDIIEIDMKTGEVKTDKKKKFITDIIATCNPAIVLNMLYENTSLIILMVRDRLEREKEERSGKNK